MAELELCPFCGAASEIRSAYVATSWRGNGVDVERRFARGCPNDGCAVRPQTEFFANWEEADDAWNHRHERKVVER